MGKRRGRTVSRAAFAFFGVSLWAMSSAALAQSVPTPDIQQPPAKADDDAAADETASVQSNGEPDVVEANEIVVTAQKREQALNDVGLTVSVLGSEQLAKEGIRTSQDLAKAVSALTVAEAADGTPVYTLRGVGFNSPNLGAQPTVSIYLDEAGLPYGPLTQGPIFDLERVEVLKGPQGTLFGQNSTGGAINYIAAKPKDEFAGGISVGYGRFNTFQGDAFVTGPLSDTLSARLAVTGTLSDDWQYNYLRDDSIGKTKRAAARLLLDWEAAPTLRFSVNLNGWIDRSDNQIPQFLAAAPRVPAQAIPALFTIPAPPHNDRAADWDPNKPFDRNNELGQAVLRADLDLTDALTLTSLTNYISASIDSRFENDGTRFGFGDVRTFGTVDVFNQEVRLAGDLASGNFLVGVNYQTDDVREGSFQIFNGTSSTVIPGVGVITTSENRAIQSNDSIGVFANGEWQLTDQLRAIAGARYTWAKHRDQSCTADPGDGGWSGVIDTLIFLFTGTRGTIQPGECISLDENFQAPFPKRSFSEDNVSWRVGLNYQPHTDMLIYGLVSRGYKAGNYPVISAAVRSSLQPVTQEQLTSFELGLKTTVSRALQLNLSGYYYDYKDKQLLTLTSDPVFGLVPVLANVPKSHVTGFDLEAVLTPTPGLTLRTAVGYADSSIGEFTDFDAFSRPVQLKGNTFNYAPKLTARSDAEYRFPMSADLEAFVGADLSYNSTSYADLAHSPELRIKPHTLLGLRAGIGSADERWQLMVWGRNVTNAYYWTNAVLGFDTLYRTTGRPATYGVSLGYKF